MQARIVVVHDAVRVSVVRAGSIAATVVILSAVDASATDFVTVTAVCRCSSYIRPQIRAAAAAAAASRFAAAIFHVVAMTVGRRSRRKETSKKE